MPSSGSTAPAGKPARFTAILAQYQFAPEVTRRRLYLESMADVLPQAKALYIVDSGSEDAAAAAAPGVGLGARRGGGNGPRQRPGATAPGVQP